MPATDRHHQSQRPIHDVEALQRHLSGEDRRRNASPEDPGRLRSSDLEVLQSVHRLGSLGRFATFRNRSAIGRLIREGFLTLDGVLDTAGDDFMRPVSTAEDVLALRGQCGTERTLMQSWLAGEQVSTVSGAPGADVMAGVVQEKSSRYTVALAERGALASQACAWAGVRAAPALLSGELLVDEDEFTARVIDPQHPVPDGSPEELTELWAEPWFVWEATSSALGVNLAFISAQGAGNYVFGADAEASERDGRLLLRLAPVTARTVWETMWVLSHGGGAAAAAGNGQREVLGVPQTGTHQLPPPDMPATR
ncbi:hypothetical protein [Microbacterium sp. A93]|uniref:hypothetical protein n=1 Tax=Microbacterium sp. A93 TaxID=3450716 RepID=UPI003F421BEA